MFKDLYATLASWFYSVAVSTDTHLAENVYSLSPLSCMDVLYKQTTYLTAELYFCLGLNLVNCLSIVVLTLNITLCISLMLLQGAVTEPSENKEVKMLLDF